MKSLSNAQRLVIGSGLVIVLVFLLAVIEVPYTVKSPCRVVAQSEWSLTQLQPDKLSSRLVRNDSNKIQTFTLLQFARQDFFRFSLSAEIRPGQPVREGQVIGSIVSSENQLILNNLVGELDKARANLEFLRTGEKAPVQEEARHALEYARAELAVFEPQLRRKQQLYDRELISKEELEIATATRDLLRAKVSLHEARLRTAQTGEKAEGIRLIRAEISRLENQIGDMREKLSWETIRSPIDGIITDAAMDGILCQVSKIDTVVIHIPIGEEQRRYLRLGQAVSIRSFHEPVTISGTVDAIGNQAQIINGRPMFIVSCLIRNLDAKLLPGTTGYAKITCDRVSVLEQLRRAWNLYAGKTFLI